MKENNHAEHKLHELTATAICGNDILSSVLYVSGFAAVFAGIYAPIVLLVIALVLFFYKAVYTEVVEALPINGGAYNCLLNSTSKAVAAIAGVTTILSYIATAVISAKVAVSYVNTVIPVPVIPLTIALLGFFALLVIMGIKDSAKVALMIFTLHVATLTIFVVMGISHFFGGHSYLMENFTATQSIVQNKGGIMNALFFAFSASLLGVSGFESSANFVEEQHQGVFRKTLRNMLITVAIFNPLVAIVSLNAAPLAVIAQSKDFLVSDIARVIGGPIVQYFVVADAFLVLAGAVLTSYVGVSGLMSRMASDACLPNSLAKTNKRGSYSYIVLSFFILCTSILLLTHGELSSLAGVYTIAFLSVMSLFALGNLILRETRSELKRTYHAPIVFIGLAFFATFFGIIGNIILEPRNFLYFMLYFIPAVTFVMLVVFQDYVLKTLLRLSKPFHSLHKYLVTQFEDLTDERYIAFIHHVDRLYPILEYLDRNETGRNLILVHCNNEDEKDHDDIKSYEEIEHILPELQKAGVHPHLNVSLKFLDKPFSPKVVDEVAKRYKVRKNRILIGSIHHHHPYEYSELGGARIIF